MQSQNSEAEKFRRSTIVAARYMVGRARSLRPPEWKSGSTQRARSPAEIGMPCVLIRAPARTPRWLSITPFGFPVVPEVYISAAVSSGRGGSTGGGSVECSERTAGRQS